MVKNSTKVDSIDDDIDAIVADEQNTNDPIEDSQSEQIDDERRPLRYRLADFVKSGPGAFLTMLLVAIIIVLSVPMMRYAALGFFVKKQAIVTVVDSTTGKPVLGATIHLAREDAVTDAKGVARVNDMPVGDHPISVEKKYYETYKGSYFVTIFKDASATVKLKATGRVASVTVINSISGQPVSDAAVKVADVTATSDEKGALSLALAADNTVKTGDVSANGYKTASITIDTNEMSPTVTVKLVPNGLAYFVSNRTGSFDVMSSALDGSDQQVAIKATGSELGTEMQLFTAPNSDFVALAARRSGDKTPNLYVLETATGTLTKVDGSESVQAIGWIDKTFYFSVYHSAANAPANGETQLLAYNAAQKQVTTLDSTTVETDQFSNYAKLSVSSRFQLVGNRIYYAKCWNYTPYYQGNYSRKASLMSVVDGKAVSLKDVTQQGDAYCDTVAVKPGIVYYRLQYSADSHIDSFRYQLNKSVETVQTNDADVYNNNYQYFTSPNGEKTLWNEVRDGKSVTFIGDSNGQNETKISSDTYQVYGWLGDSYILYSKGSSELFIAAVGSPLDGAHKITDFYSPYMRPY